MVNQILGEPLIFRLLLKPYIDGLTNIVQHQVGATNLTSALEKFRKLDLPAFKGTKDPIEANNWLKEIKRIFREMEVSDE